MLFVSFFLLLLYIELLVNEHFAQTLFWPPDTLEVFRCGGESWTEGFTEVVSCCKHQ